MVKLPTGKDDAGDGTGKTDFSVDFDRQQGSGESCRGVRLRRLRMARQARRVRHPGRRVPLGRRRRVPVAQLAAGHRRAERLRAVAATRRRTTRAVHGIDGSHRRRSSSDTENITRATLGLTAQNEEGLLLRRRRELERADRRRATDVPRGRATTFGDYYDWQFRIGYHPGVRVYVPPPPPPRPPPPPAAAAAGARPDGEGASAIRARWKSARASTVTATAPGFDRLRGDLSLDGAERHAGAARPSGRRSGRRRSRKGRVPVTVTVTCPTDNRTASRHGQHPGDAAAGQELHVRGRVLRLRPLLRCGRKRRACWTKRSPRCARTPTLRVEDRRAHLQHRHGRIQPRARRSPRERGEGLPRQPRRHRRSAADGELRRGAAEVRQRPRGDAPPEPSRRARR